MYVIRLEMVDLLKDGRTNAYISEQLGLTQQHIGNILNGYKCTYLTAKSLISMKEKIAINDDRMEELLKYYFDKI